MRKQLIRFLSLIMALIVLAGAFLPQSVYAAKEEKPDYATLGEVNAEAALIVAGDAGAVLYEKNAHKRRSPASMAKMMTALLVLEAVDAGMFSLDDQIPFSEHVTKEIPWDASRLNEVFLDGELITVREYLYAMMLSSDAYSCYMMAREVSGNVASFVEAMNEKAKELGCEDTAFCDVTGYGSVADGNYSTAYDIYLIMQAVLKYEDFCEIVSTPRYEMPATNLHGERVIRNTNCLISMEYYRMRYGNIHTDTTYKYAVGVKTGTTDEAGACLAGAARADGIFVYTVVMGAGEPTKEPESGLIKNTVFTESKRMMQWVFYNYEIVPAFKEGVILKSVTANDNGEEIYINVAADKTLTSVALPAEEEQEIEYRYEIGELSTPISAGQEIGTVTAYYGEACLGTTKLISVDEHEKTVREKKNVLLSNGATVVAVIIAVIVVISAVAILLDKKAKKKKMAQKRRARRNYRDFD